MYRWNIQTQEWQLLEPDNYFNNHIYRSGVTYQKMAMVSPLFFPVVNDNGISKGFESNRFIAHHFGAKGYITDEIEWKGMATYIKHLGTWRKPFNPEKRQLSTFLEIVYSGSKIPFNIGMTLAGDIASAEKDRLGFNLSLTKSW